VLHAVVREHLETWLALEREVPGFVERDFRKYVTCGVLGHGFGRARCPGCGHDFLVAFSCRARAVCPSCNARRMAETAAHLVDHVFPRAPIRQ
jgi:ribosomal protein S27E